MSEASKQKMEDKALVSAASGRSVSGVYRYAVGWFLGALTLMFITAPLLEDIGKGEGLLAAIMTLVLLSAVVAVGNNRSTLVWGIVLVIPALAARWMYHLRPDMMPAPVFLIFGMLFIIFITAHLFGFIFRSPRVDSEVLCAAMAVYLMLALLWSLAYILVAAVVPDSFVFSAGPVSGHAMKGFTALYFSFITLCTVGYGDIVPVSGMARALAMMEAGVGVFYVATLISRLVAIYSSREPTEGKPP